MHPKKFDYTSLIHPANVNELHEQLSQLLKDSNNQYAGCRIISERAASAATGFNRSAIHNIYEKLMISGLLHRKDNSYSYIVNDLNSICYGQCIGLAIPRRFSEYIISHLHIKPRLHLYLGIAERAAELGIGVLPIEFPDLDVSRREIMDFSRSKLPNLAGIIYLGEPELHQNVSIDWLWSNRTIPQVSLLMHNKYAHCGCVTFSLTSAMRSVAEHFREYGHFDIGVFLPPNSAQLRYEISTPSEIMDVFAGSGMNIRPEWIRQITFGDDSHLSAELDAFLKLPGHPRAIWCMNDHIAFAVMKELTRRGKSVPGDYSVIGMNDLDNCESSVPPLTSVHLPFYGCGRAAVDKLIEIRHHGNRNLQTLRLQPLLTVRKSVGRRNSGEQGNDTIFNSI